MTQFPPSSTWNRINVSLVIWGSLVFARLLYVGARGSGQVQNCVYIGTPGVMRGY